MARQGVGWGVGGEGAGGCETPRKCKPGVGSGQVGGWGVGGEGAGGCETPRKCKPGVGSGQVGVGWGVGGEGAGGCGHALAAFKYSQNT